MPLKILKFGLYINIFISILYLQVAQGWQTVIFICLSTCSNVIICILEADSGSCANTPGDNEPALVQVQQQQHTADRPMSDLASSIDAGCFLTAEQDGQYMQNWMSSTGDGMNDCTSGFDVDQLMFQPPNQVFVFSTEMANQAAEAVVRGQSDSIVDFHWSSSRVCPLHTFLFLLCVLISLKSLKVELFVFCHLFCVI